MTQSLQYLSNGFTLSLFANGTAWTSGSQGGGFSLDAEVPVNLAIGGPNRSIVVYRDASQNETLQTNAGTSGQALYAFNHFTVISRAPDGGDSMSLDYNYTAPTSIGTWSLSDLLSRDFGMSMQMTGMVTDGALFASMSASQTFRFYEADGITPVSLISATPEPASVALSLGGMAICYLAFRRRRSEAVRCS